MKKIAFFLSATMLFIPAVARAQASSTSSSGAQQTPEGIQKGSNEYGMWGSVSFDATTWIGATPDARFGNVGLRYGRVLAASKKVVFEWTIDAIPVAILQTLGLLLHPAAALFSIARVCTAGGSHQLV